MDKIYSLDDLDVTKKCEEAYEFELVDDADGKGIGVFLTVIGGHAPAIKEFVRKSLNARRRVEAMNERRGKKDVIRPIEEDEEFSTEVIAMRVIGWRGIADPWSREGAVRLCANNPSIKEQILRVSDDMANFTQRLMTH